ncbi:homocysteine S-methyltransferase family protein [Desulfuromonas acetoxidans]|uniref:Methionine synthase n=1 Tax=Desulfuromonas acetoxidans (strain DSM 684 / 11070) TaxID=281689 RepID=Q1JWJ4_DESA6|nr:homocysteine S-methyltransferase family protein [Desulfuromonas acetoxidans]EAT14574.1 homocysteine S-methyltransferase [Desulfuromonas acetoxidans DSM 684]MBF0646281.1 homocysteine S-methyltransferase family protein [Desulfuromonas acetoxidans]NVD25719.1 homocysteine S-methyltransferase family protein [Desulfuromonas acetoxidans]NVE17015.1 homocysteine S-methyltransferase family protein [Desulfuromonas acetoxidans]
MNRFLEAIQQRVLILDGAMGTMLQARGLAAGGCPELMNLEKPEVVEGVHRDYAQAGAQIIVTNTFGGTRSKLEHYGLEDKVYEINVQAARLARAALADPANDFVAGSIGPTGRFVEPVGDATFDEMVEIYAEQVKALVAGGVDLLTCETFLDIRELKAAVMACREYADVPVMAMMTFDDGGRTVLGTPPAAAAVMLEGLGVDVVGTNCGLGIDGMYELLGQMRDVCSCPLIAQANAGLPILKDGETIFPATPVEMTSHHDQLIALGVRVLGGCCGTTPEHIRVMRQAMDERGQQWTAPARRGVLSSRTQVVAVGPEQPCAIIGERINPTGKKGYSAELREGKTAYIRREAQQQTGAGATLLDVNCGAPGADEPLALERAVHAITGVVGTPLVLDSSDPIALERGLKAADGKVLINSVNGEEKSLATVLPLAKKYGAAIIGLTLDGQGIPQTAEGRVEIAERIIERAQAVGIQRCDIVIDCLALTVSAEQGQAIETLKAIRTLTQDHGMATVLGVSNISFGLPRRPLMSSTFFAMALQAGLSAAIINPKDQAMMDAFRSAMVLLGKDLRAERYIDAYAEVQETAPAVAAVAGAEPSIRERLAQAIIDGDQDGVVALVELALKDGLDVLQISNEGLLAGLEEVGRRFGANRIFLPQVLLSAETMKTAFARLRQEMKGEQVASLGKIMMATVEGDIHDIGKNIVCTLLENHGYEVIDLGKNVSAAHIVEQAQAAHVDAVGLSALMTTTLQQMQITIDALKEAGVKVFTMVGGAVVTQDYADEIGADLYAEDALEAVAKIKQMLHNA